MRGRVDLLEVADRHRRVPSAYTRVLTDRCDQASAGCNGYRPGLRASTSPWWDAQVTGPALVEIGSFDAFPRQRAQAAGMKRPAFDAEEHRAIVRVAGQLRTRLAPIFVDPRDPDARSTTEAGQPTAQDLRVLHNSPGRSDYGTKKRSRFFRRNGRSSCPLFRCNKRLPWRIFRYPFRCPCPHRLRRGRKA